jgi:Flp pilus assembly protein protease CpaA
MGTKKGKGTPIALEVPLPVIFSTVIVVTIYLRGKRCPISNRVIIILFLLSIPSSVFSVARNSLALPLVDWLII